MSDLYLELVSRIPVVAQKTVIGADRLQEVQDSAGLSNERIARKIPISERTWRRWKEDGAIPTASLPAVAAALGLELRELRPQQLEVISGGGEDDRYEQLAAQMRAQAEALRDVAAEIAALRRDLGR